MNLDNQENNYVSWSPEIQLELYSDENHTYSENINESIIEHKKSVDESLNLINKEQIFLNNEKIKFFNIKFNQDENNFFITFLVNKNTESNNKNEDLNITITINKNNKYNNILVTQEGIKDLSIKLELIKYFLTAEGFHNLMKTILELNNAPQELLNIKYNHKKYWTAESFYNNEKLKYKWEKGNLWKVWLSSNYFPDLFILKDNSNVEFNKDQFLFKLELEIDKKLYIVEWTWLKTINNWWNHDENIIHTDIQEYNVLWKDNISDSLKEQIKRHIIYYIQEL